MLRPATLLALAVSLAACAAPDEPAPDVPAPAGVADDAPGAERSGEPAAGPEAEDATAVALALDAEGVRTVDAASGSTRPVAFGTPEAEAVAAVERLRGAAPERTENAECGAGPVQFATWPDGFAMHVQDGTFVGWALNDGAGEVSTLTTLSGLGIGSTRAELDAAYAATVEETSLGTEFAAGGLFGLLSGPGPDATVEHLWAGVSCTFR